MTKLEWAPDNYEYGVDRGVSYPLSGPGLAWNGLISVDESSDSDEKTLYLDGARIGQRRRLGEFSASISTFTYPPGLEPASITNSNNRLLGLSYRVMSENSYKIHIVYNVRFSPVGAGYAYDELVNFNLDATTRSVTGPEGLTVTHLIVDSGIAYNSTLDALETILYGSDLSDPRLPSPLEVYELFEENAILRVVDHGDGRWTATGPDEAITVNPDGTFEISWPSAIFINATTYKISSL